MVEPVALEIFGNIGIDEENLAIVDLGIGLADRGLAATQGFDLGAGQDDASLVAVEDLVMEPRLPVIRRNP